MRMESKWLTRKKNQTPKKAVTDECKIDKMYRKNVPYVSLSNDFSSSDHADTGDLTSRSFCGPQGCVIFPAHQCVTKHTDDGQPGKPPKFQCSDFSLGFH